MIDDSARRPNGIYEKIIIFPQLEFRRSPWIPIFAVTFSNTKLSVQAHTFRLHEYLNVIGGRISSTRRDLLCMFHNFQRWRISHGTRPVLFPMGQSFSGRFSGAIAPNYRHIAAYFLVKR